MGRFYDVTLPIADGMKVYPGDTSASVEEMFTIEEEGCSVSKLKFSSHIGTHIDAPCHFIKGAKAVDEMPHDLMIGKVEIVETKAKMIDRDVLEQADIAHWDAIFFKTSNQSLWKLREFSEDYVSLTEDAADLLIEKKTRLVGIDYFSIETFHTHDYPVHRRLLGNGLFIIEGLYLNDVSPGLYGLHAMPLRLERADGAPLRVILEAR